MLAKWNSQKKTMSVLFGCWSKSTQACWETQQSSKETFGKTALNIPFDFMSAQNPELNTDWVLIRCWTYSLLLLLITMRFEPVICLCTFTWECPRWLTFSGWTNPSPSLYWVQRSRKSIRHNGWRPSRINEARKSGQPLDLADQEAGRGGKKRRRAACDVHAWSWGFRLMVCV